MNASLSVHSPQTNKSQNGTLVSSDPKNGSFFNNVDQSSFEMQVLQSDREFHAPFYVSMQTDANQGDEELPENINMESQRS